MIGQMKCSSELGGSLILKSFLLGAFLLPSVGHAQSPVYENPAVMPVLTRAPIDNVFVPVGFDDNDNVELIVHGHFADSCNKMGPTLGTVDPDNFVIEVGARAFRYPSDDCVSMEVPFMKAISLGQLKAGTYTVKLAAGEAGEAAALSQTLTVAEATRPSADDSLYAPVDTVQFAPVPGSAGVYSLTVSGTFPRSANGCMILESVESLPYPSVLVVLPVARFETDLSLCPSSANAFERSFSSTRYLKLDLDRDLLLHVRVLNGQSVNKVVEVEN